MRHMVQITVAVIVASLLAGVTLSADGNHDLRIRRNQLVILNAMPHCDGDIITIRGKNFGAVFPHVTLNLMQLGVISLDVSDPDDNVVVATLGDEFDFCGAPATYLLTVMRPRMKHRRRWLKLTKKDLGTLDVAVGMASLDDVTGLQSQIDDNAGDIADNATGVAANATGIAANSTGVLANAAGIAANMTGIAANSADIATNDTDISELSAALTTHADDPNAHHVPGGGGGGGSSLLHVNGNLYRTGLTPPPGFSVPAGTLSVQPVASALRVTAQGGLRADDNSKTITCRAQGLTLATQMTSSNGGSWRFVGEVTPKGPQNATAVGHMMVFGANGALVTETMSSIESIAIAGSGFDSTDFFLQCTIGGGFIGVSQRSFLVELLQ